MEVYILKEEFCLGREDELANALTPRRRSKYDALKHPSARRLSLCAGLLMTARFGSAEPEISPLGKPYFPDGPAFSLSHTKGAAILAVGQGDGSAGADIEEADRSSLSAAGRFFTKPERDYFARRPDDGFAFLWTRKEAVLKATGMGFYVNPLQYSVLEDTVDGPDGKAYSLFSCRWDKYTISTAAEFGSDPTFLPLVLNTMDFSGGSL